MPADLTSSGVIPSSSASLPSSVLLAGLNFHATLALGVRSDCSVVLCFHLRFFAEHVSHVRLCFAEPFELRHHGLSESTRAAACPPRRFSLPKKVCQRRRLTERLHRRSSTTMWTASAQFPQRRRPRRNARPSSFFGRPAAFRTHAVTTLRPKRFGKIGEDTVGRFF